MKLWLALRIGFLAILLYAGGEQAAEDPVRMTGLELAISSVFVATFAIFSQVIKWYQFRDKEGGMWDWKRRPISKGSGLADATTFSLGAVLASLSWAAVSAFRHEDVANGGLLFLEFFGVELIGCFLIHRSKIARMAPADSAPGARLP